MNTSRQHEEGVLAGKGHGLDVSTYLLILAAPVVGIVMSCYALGKGWDGLGMGMVALAMFAGYSAWGVWLVRWSTHTEHVACPQGHSSVFPC